MSPARRVRRVRAFTLIELLTVMAVIAILFGISLGLVRGSRQRLAIARARAELVALQSALEEYRRAYGDYPQLFNFNQVAQLTPTNTTTGPGIGTAQAKLFNCLTGVFGPRAFNNPDRINGPTFLDVGKFTPNPATLPATFQVLIIPGPGQGPVKQEQNVGLLDPWGRYYLYYYKSAANPALWQAPGYILYSAGPDGAHTAPPNTGVLTTTQLNATNNADNLYATTP